MRLGGFTLFSLALLAVSSSSLRAAVVFNFDADVPGKSTQFTDTVSGLSATFASSGDPGGFAVIPTFFFTLTGNVLLDPGPAGLDNLTLTITFSAPQTSIFMNFATNSSPGVPFNLNAFNGATAAGSATAVGSVPSGFFFPEGLISFNGPTFNRIVLSSPAALDFAIDNVTVGPVPEPASVLLAAFGALAAAGIRRRPRFVASRNPE